MHFTHQSLEIVAIRTIRFCGSAESLLRNWSNATQLSSRLPPADWFHCERQKVSMFRGMQTAASLSLSLSLDPLTLLYSSNTRMLRDSSVYGNANYKSPMRSVSLFTARICHRSPAGMQCRLQPADPERKRERGGIKITKRTHGGKSGRNLLPPLLLLLMLHASLLLRRDLDA